MPHTWIGWTLAIARLQDQSSCSYRRTVGCTSAFPKTSDIFAVHELGMFDPWSNCGDVCMFERDFQSVEHSSIGFVTNGVNTLNAHRAGVSAGEGKHAVGVRTTCHPSSRYLGIILFRVLDPILM